MSKKVKMILGSVRQGRTGEPISVWAVAQAAELGIELEVLDLKVIDIPFLEAPIPPAYAPVDTEKAKQWAAMIADADGIVFLTPEYNRSIPASLKNAIDHLSTEWNGKSAVIVSYGYIDGGARATAHLKDIFDWLKVSVVEPVTNIQLSQDMMSDQGGFKDIDSALADYKDSFVKALQAL